NPGACRFRFDIVDLPRDEDQQTAKTELTSVPQLSGDTSKVQVRTAVINGDAALGIPITEAVG
ncbi:MAG: hypothetical protein ACO1OA_10325, partial [Paracoccus marcusii]